MFQVLGMISFFCGSPGLTSTLAFEKKATQYKKTKTNVSKVQPQN